MARSILLPPGDAGKWEPPSGWIWGCAVQPPQPGRRVKGDPRPQPFPLAPAPGHTLSASPSHVHLGLLCQECGGAGHRGLLRTYSSAPVPATPPNVYTWGPLVAHSLLCTCPHLASAVPSRSGTSCVLCLETTPPFLAQASSLEKPPNAPPHPLPLDPPPPPICPVQKWLCTGGPTLCREGRGSWH